MGSRRRSWAASLAHTANRISSTPIDGGDRLRTAGRWLGGVPPVSLRDAVENKIVLITGASSGIGRATAIRAGRAGAVVVVVARRAESLAEVVAKIRDDGGQAFTYPCDLADLSQVDALVAAVLSEHGHVDILVNNAGKSIRRRATGSFDRFEDFERPMQLNYFAAIRLAMGLLPSMIERRSGQVANISTWAVPLRPSKFSGYTASKAALEAWSDTVQAELMGSGIVFTNIRMPLVRTPMIAPTERYRKVPALAAREAAKVVCDAMVSRSRRLTPLATKLPSAIDAVSPGLSDRLRSRSG